MKKISYFISICCLLLPAVLRAQVSPDSSLYKTILHKDSLMFNVGFNTCDLSQFESLLSAEFRFYHDQGGITGSKQAFIDQLRNGLCQSSDYQARRELIPGTTLVFPLYNQGEIYGALQSGEHRFFEKQEGKPEVAGSTAKFTHVWVLEGGDWKLQESLSYDHQMKD